MVHLFTFMCDILIFNLKFFSIRSKVLKIKINYLLIFLAIKDLVSHRKLLLIKNFVNVEINFLHFVLLFIHLKKTFQINF
jgi:hypothetical protein